MNRDYFLHFVLHSEFDNLNYVIEEVHTMCGTSLGEVNSLGYSLDRHTFEKSPRRCEECFNSPDYALYVLSKLPG